MFDRGDDSMPDTKDNYRLLPDAILGGRYRIERVIGEGGFGITYEAVNSKIDMTVAIKEFYCREYIRRDVAKSNQIQVAYAAMEEILERAKSRFLQEAKTLSEFSDESAIVRIMDYFEENGTAYIVMNYLHGTPLNRYLEENGPMDWQTMAEKMKPLITTLERIHKRGVIHRDISPDNIMVLEDGSLCLLDFGTAKDTFRQDRSSTMIFTKQGYTPMEQYAEGGNIGAWSDVYALTAVCYECLAGACPPDSLQRMVFDEYKTLAELGKDVPAAADAMLKKGLALKVEDRYADMGQLLHALEEISKKGKHRRGWRRKRWIAAALVFILASAAGVGYYWTHREQIYFHFEETESFCLVRDKDASVDEFKRDFEKIEGRIRLFAGGEAYRCKRNEDEIRAVLPLKCFGGEDPMEVIRDLIARPCRWTLDGVSVEPEFVTAVTFRDEEKEELEIRFAENTPENVQKILKGAGSNDEVTLSVDTGYSHHLSMTGKGESPLVYTCNLQEQWKDKKNRELFAHNISEDPLQVTYNIYSQIQSAWEEKDAGTAYGERQCSVEELGDNTVTLEYWEDYISEELSEGDIVNFTSAVKERLDLLGISYAMGRERQHSKRVTLCVKQGDFNRDLFYLLPQAKSCLQVVSANGVELADEYDVKSIETAETGPGSGTAILRSADEEAVKKEIRKKTEKLAKKNIAAYYLMSDSIRLLEGRLAGEDGNLKRIDNGEFTFHSVKMGNGKITGDNERVVALLNHIIEDKNSIPGYYKNILACQYSNGDELVALKPEETCEAMNFDTTYEDKVAGDIRKLSDDYDVMTGFDYEDGEEMLRVVLPKELYAESLTDPGILLEHISQIMKVCSMEDGTPWSAILLAIRSRYEEGNNAAIVRFVRNDNRKVTDAGQIYSISVISYEKKEAEWLKKACAQMKKDERFEGYEIEFTDYSDYRIY